MISRKELEARKKTVLEKIPEEWATTSEILSFCNKKLTIDKLHWALYKLFAEDKIRCKKMGNQFFWRKK